MKYLLSNLGIMRLGNNIRRLISYNDIHSIKRIGSVVSFVNCHLKLKTWQIQFAIWLQMTEQHRSEKG